MVEHLVAGGGTGEEGDRHVMAKYLGAQIQRRLKTCEDLQWNKINGSIIIERISP